MPYKIEWNGGDYSNVEHGRFYWDGECGPCGRPSVKRKGGVNKNIPIVVDAFLDCRGYSPQLIRMQGLSFIAGEIVAKALHDRISFLRCSHPAIGYGPGGKKTYFLVHPGLIDRFMTVSGWGGRNDKEKGRSDAIGEVALAMIDLIPSADECEKMAASIKEKAK